MSHFLWWAQMDPGTVNSEEKEKEHIITYNSPNGGTARAGGPRARAPCASVTFKGAVIGRRSCLAHRLEARLLVLLDQRPPRPVTRFALPQRRGRKCLRRFFWYKKCLTRYLQTE